MPEEEKGSYYSLAARPLQLVETAFEDCTFWCLEKPRKAKIGDDMQRLLDIRYFLDIPILGDLIYVDLITWLDWGINGYLHGSMVLQKIPGGITSSLPSVWFSFVLLRLLSSFLLLAPHESVGGTQHHDDDDDDDDDDLLDRSDASCSGGGTAIIGVVVVALAALSRRDPRTVSSTAIFNPSLSDMAIYPSSHNHGSEKWVPPVLLTFQIEPFSTEP